jgi:O-antigen ligase
VFITFFSGGDATRFAIWKGAWGMIKGHPFLGVGLGTFMANFSRFTKGLGVQYAHNCFLQIWAETGVFALVSFIGFISLVLWEGITTFRRTQDGIVLGLICAIFASLVHSFFDTHLYSLQLAVLFWFLAGMLVVGCRKIDKINSS